jgi:DKNYY family
MKETTRRDKPGLFTNGGWRRQSDARTALSASRLLVAACRQAAAFLQHIEASGALPGIRCSGLLATMTLKWQADRFKLRTWIRTNNRLYQLKKQTCVNTRFSKTAKNQERGGGDENRKMVTMKTKFKYDSEFRPYKVEGDAVYIDDKLSDAELIEGADAATFKPLNHHFSSDAKHVFSGTKILRGVSPASFRVLNELYAIGGKKVHYSFGWVPTADYKSFEALDAGFWHGDYGIMFEGYARDKNGIWFYSLTIGKPRILKSADPESFKVLRCAFARDARRVFSDGLPVPKADPASFKLITQRYARDRSRIFYGDAELKGVDYDSFESVNARKNQAKDKYHLYNGHRRVDAY